MMVPGPKRDIYYLEHITEFGLRLDIYSKLVISAGLKPGVYLKLVMAPDLRPDVYSKLIVAPSFESSITIYSDLYRYTNHFNLRKAFIKPTGPEFR